MQAALRFLKDGDGLDDLPIPGSALAELDEKLKDRLPVKD